MVNEEIIKRLSIWERFCCRHGWHKWVKEFYDIYVQHLTPAKVCGHNYTCKRCQVQGEMFFEDPFKRIKSTGVYPQ